MQNAGSSTSLSSTVSSIYSSSGLTGFYRGYVGNLARDVPFRVFQMVAYEVVKKGYHKRVNSGKRNSAVRQLSSAETAFCGAMAGTFSAAITNPLDVVKTRMMPGANPGAGWAETIKLVHGTSGLGGFAKGIVPRVGLIAPSVALFFIVYEKSLQRLTTIKK